MILLIEFESLNDSLNGIDWWNHLIKAMTGRKVMPDLIRRPNNHTLYTLLHVFICVIYLQPLLHYIIMQTKSSDAKWVTRASRWDSTTESILPFNPPFSQQFLVSCELYNIGQTNTSTCFYSNATRLSEVQDFF